MHPAEGVGWYALANLRSILLSLYMPVVVKETTNECPQHSQSLYNNNAQPLPLTHMLPHSRAHPYAHIHTLTHALIYAHTRTHTHRFYQRQVVAFKERAQERVRQGQVTNQQREEQECSFYPVTSPLMRSPSPVRPRPRHRSVSRERAVQIYAEQVTVTA